MKNKTIFECGNCGYKVSKWMGRCPECQEWDTFVEETEVYSGPARKLSVKEFSNIVKPIPIDSIDIEDISRILTRIKEFDRVLGGGIVPGSLVLIGGDPGIGKSTIMLQVLSNAAKNGQKVLYVSGEESVNQIKLRSIRLSAVSKNLMVAAEIDMDIILAMAESEKPDIMVIDSIQTMYSADLSSAPGSVSQVREAAMRLMVMSKKSGIPVFLIGHVTKDGAIAGPKVMEHMVDTVLYFEGDRNHIFRILRTVKNRFGPTNEIGVFEMRETGLIEVENPSAVFLSEHNKETAGSVVTASMEGTRPILIELQALVSRTNFGTPRRTILGLDHNRVALLAAVMEKKLNIPLMGYDIFMNVTGGVKVYEPAVDLGIIASIASSFFDKPVSNQTAVLGEAGLTGEIRAVGQIETRIAEAKKMGFKKFVLPLSNYNRISNIKGIKLLGVEELSDLPKILFDGIR